MGDFTRNTAKKQRRHVSDEGRVPLANWPTPRPITQSNTLCRIAVICTVLTDVIINHRQQPEDVLVRKSSDCGTCTGGSPRWIGSGMIVGRLDGLVEVGVSVGKLDGLAVEGTLVGVVLEESAVVGCSLAHYTRWIRCGCK